MKSVFRSLLSDHKPKVVCAVPRLSSESAKVCHSVTAFKLFQHHLGGCVAAMQSVEIQIRF